MIQSRGKSCDVNAHNGARAQEYNRMAGLHQAELFVGRKTGDRGSISMSTPDLEKGARASVSKNSFGTSREVRTLCKAGKLKEALHNLIGGGIQADSETYVCLLKECTNMKELIEGKQVHAHIIRSGFKPSIFLLNTLVNMYAKCSSLVDARQVFDKMSERNAYTWTIMIAGYAQQGYGREALEIYELMLQKKVTPDRVTFISVLYACSSLGALVKGKEVHADIMKVGIVSYVNLENTLLDMYAKCGSIKDARQVFDSMAERNVVSWNTMIGGYTQHASGREALEIYEQMNQEGVMPDQITFICTLNACASLGALERGKEVHADIIKAGIASYINLENTLVDMYAKCGSMKEAHQVFDNMAKRNMVSWSTMIAGCAQHGCGREALQLFEHMILEGLRPNGITFLSLLSACSHVGLVDEGCHYFDSMSRDYGITPTAEHFGSMVDLLGRAGRLEEAEDFVNKLPMDLDSGVRRALLGACKIHHNVEMAERVAKSVVKSDAHAGAYVRLASMLEVGFKTKVFCRRQSHMIANSASRF